MIRLAMLELPPAAVAPHPLGFPRLQKMEEWNICTGKFGLLALAGHLDTSGWNRPR